MKPVPHGEPYAGKLHVRFDEGAGVPDNKGRPALLYTPLYSIVLTCTASLNAKRPNTGGKAQDNCPV